MATTIFYVSCPVCRRRYPSKILTTKASGDFEVIDYPVQSAISLGCRGFSVLDYYTWTRLGEVPSDVGDALLSFLIRVQRTYALLEKLGLLQGRGYSESYSKPDDVVRAYQPSEVSYLGY